MRSQGATYKRCGCRTGLVPAKQKDGSPRLRNGKPVMVCPKLRSSRHGSWFWALRIEKDKPPVRKGGFSSQEEAQKDLAEYKRLRSIGVEIGGDAETPFEEFWDAWLLGKGKLSPATADAYKRVGDLYLKPAFGRVAIGKLRKTHGDLMFTAIGLIGEELPATHPTHAEHARMMAVRKSGRRPGVPQMHRILTALNSAMNSAVRERVIEWNPMQHIELPDEQEPEALLWTDRRVEEWKRTGEKPSKVMVWTAEQTGTFLDSIVDQRLYAFFHLLAMRGLRRGEGIGAMWTKLDWERGVLDVDVQMYRAGGVIHEVRPKGGSSGDVPLDDLTLSVLRDWEKTQRRERLAHGEAWVDSGRIFTRADGRPLSPDDMSDLFAALATASGLPPIRLHDLRHGAASLTYAVTKDLKIVQRLLRHKVPAMTHRYTTLFEQAETDAAEKASASVPRRRVPTAFPQSGVADVIPAQFPNAVDNESAGQNG